MARGTNANEAESGAGQAPSPDAVARRAYELFEERGREPGHELEDWLAAEAELAGGDERLAVSSSGASPTRQAAESPNEGPDVDRDPLEASSSGSTANGSKRRNGASGRRRSADRAQ